MKKINGIWKFFNEKGNQQSVNGSQETVNDHGSQNVVRDAEDVVNDGQHVECEGKARIYNLIIVDESGSMIPLKDATLSGINATINTIRFAQKEFASTQQHMLSLVTFDSGSHRPDVRTNIDNKPISEVTGFSDYHPWGATPLYDAMGKSLTVLHDRIKNDSNATVVVTVLTDGLENASTEWDASKLRRLIEQLKEEGWSFSYMGSAHNVQEVTDLLSIENVVEFSHDDYGAGNTWERERSSRRAYYERMNEMYREEGNISEEEKLERKRRYAKEYYHDRVSPYQIRHLKENEIFVFGSNAQGMHNGGAAEYAKRNFGAVMGQGEGLQGHSYAIPTMEGIQKMEEAIHRFTIFASEHPELRFLVTRIGCGVAGHPINTVAPLFRECIHLENVALPADFWEVLGLKMH